jgi:hypothetical protein
MITVEFGLHKKKVFCLLPSNQGQKCAIKVISRWQHLIGKSSLHAWFLWHGFNTQPQKRRQNICLSCTVIPLCRKSDINNISGNCQGPSDICFSNALISLPFKNVFSLFLISYNYSLCKQYSININLSLIFISKVIYFTTIYL